MSGDVTQLLEQWRDGRAEALDELIPYIYGELHQLARSALSQERTGHTLQPTALVNEVYLRLAGSRIPDLPSRRQFYGVAARLMRQILVDHARRHLSEKRGEGTRHIALDAALTYSSSSAAEFTALDEALERLAEVHERKARIIELHFFTGLTVQETAELLGLSQITVHRDLSFATAFLGEQLGTP
jgi:RNA polymerase sigma-70 factor (ECF subfamily)